VRSSSAATEARLSTSPLFDAYSMIAERASQDSRSSSGPPTTPPTGPTPDPALRLAEALVELADYAEGLR
jgi:hypothetical protein